MNKLYILFFILGYRSVCRDLEAQILLVTEDEELARKILEVFFLIFKLKLIIILLKFI